MDRLQETLHAMDDTAFGEGSAGLKLRKKFEDWLVGARRDVHNFPAPGPAGPAAPVTPGSNGR
jgi:hypothetical protein